MPLRRIILLLAGALLALPLAAQEGDLSVLSAKLRDQLIKSKRKVIAILDISNTENYSNAFSNYMVDELGIRLVEDSPGFRIVTRSRLGQLMKERGLRQVEGFDANSFRQLGQFTGADAVITGSFQVLSSSIRVVLQVLDVSAGSLIAGASGSVPKTKDIEAYLQLKSPDAPKRAEGVAPAGIQETEWQCIIFRLHQCSAAATVVTCKFIIVSPGKDRSLRLGENANSGYHYSALFDQAGGQYRNTGVRAANRSEGYAVGMLLVRDVPTPAEIDFAVNTDITGIPLLRIAVRDDAGAADLDFRNVRPLKK